MLSQKAINDFKKIWKKEFKEDISDEKAEKKGLELLKFIKLIYKPIPKKEMKKFVKENP